jgi:outer membrane usher protein FimD/PapC
MNGVRICLILLLSQFLMSSVAWGEFRMTPSFLVREEYNDNIDLERDGESDFITLLRGAYHITWETRLFELNLDLGLEYEKYLHNSDEDDLRPSQGSQLESTFNIYRDMVFLRISDTYERVAIDESDEGGIDNNLTNLTDSNRLEINPYALFDFSRTLQLRLDYVYENLWYDDEDGDDAEYHRYSTTLTKILTPHITTSLNCGYTQYRPKDTLNSRFDLSGEEEYDRRDVSLNLQWQPFEELVFAADIGRAWLDYEFMEDYDTNLLGLSMDYQLSRTLFFSLAYREDIETSVEDGAQDSREYTCSLNYAGRISTSLQLFTRTDDYIEEERQDDAVGGILSVEIPFTHKYGVNTLLSYTDYDEDAFEYSEEYQRYGLRIGLFRELRIGRVSIGYTYNRNDSDMYAEDYTNNIIYTQLALSW